MPAWSIQTSSSIFSGGGDAARKFLETWVAKGLLAVSTLTHLEVYQRIRPGEEPATSAFLDGLQSIPMDVRIARHAGQLLGKIRSRGMTVGITDAIIAATTIQLEVPLLTNNIEHYPFAGLNVVRGIPR